MQCSYQSGTFLCTPLVICFLHRMPWRYYESSGMKMSRRARRRKLYPTALLQDLLFSHRLRPTVGLPPSLPEWRRRPAKLAPMEGETFQAPPPPVKFNTRETSALSRFLRRTQVFGSAGSQPPGCFHRRCRAPLWAVIMPCPIQRRPPGAQTGPAAPAREHQPAAWPPAPPPKRRRRRGRAGRGRAWDARRPAAGCLAAADAMPNANK
jgi:hypothetical protein